MYRGEQALSIDIGHNGNGYISRALKGLGNYVIMVMSEN